MISRHRVGLLLAAAVLAACSGPTVAGIAEPEPGPAPAATAPVPVVPITAAPITTASVWAPPLFVVAPEARAASPVALIGEHPDVSPPCPASEPSQPRGIRNCNPGNLGDDGWIGAVECSAIAGNREERFACFADPEHGIRALTKNAQAYFARDGIRTLARFFERWAPSGDGNVPAAYAAAVARSLRGDGWQVDAGTDLVAGGQSADCGFLRSLAEAITLHENGEQPYPASTLATGVSLACAA